MPGESSIMSVCPLHGRFNAWLLDTGADERGAADMAINPNEGQVVLVVGAGDATGGAIARRFAAGG